MPKHPMIPAPNAPKQMTADEMAALIKKAVPMSLEKGCIVSGEHMRVFVIGRHPLALDEIVIAVPFSAFMQFAANMIFGVVSPALQGQEHAHDRAALKKAD